LIIVINNEGKAIVASSAAIANEDSETFSWIFLQMMNAVKTEPTIIITDGFFLFFFFSCLFI